MSLPCIVNIHKHGCRFKEMKEDRLVKERERQVSQLTGLNRVAENLINAFSSTNKKVNFNDCGLTALFTWLGETSDRSSNITVTTENDDEADDEEEETEEDIRLSTNLRDISEEIVEKIKKLREKNGKVQRAKRSLTVKSKNLLNEINDLQGCIKLLKLEKNSSLAAAAVTTTSCSQPPPSI